MTCLVSWTDVRHVCSQTNLSRHQSSVLFRCLLFFFFRSVHSNSVSVCETQTAPLERRKPQSSSLLIGFVITMKQPPPGWGKLGWKQQMLEGEKKLHVWGVKNKRCGHSNLQQRTVFNLLFLYYASNVTAVCKFWSCTTTMLMLPMILCCKTITWCFKNSVLFPRLTQSPSGEAVYQLHPQKENKRKVAKTARNMLTDSD